MGTLCCAPFVCFGTIFQDYVGSYETPPTPPNFLKGREKGARNSFIAQIVFEKVFYPKEGGVHG